ncbi:hypothetical protein GUITHDRAFT_113984 [Guillardia theta CCMP2712]|uniref:Uncharacterized protein n=1 Tax=Guillardia theta (strain CCMP2712) TaxID=905079 RepID=L1IVR9_GUITC|nr:hypothetical protein GUITHDRAFT_113984 [Guillardia theta CCMP2712]EKX39989.1 hypothetical protein GUITHDRAFT_113984 [Guillardia theta CCMP2712]|eukprot:XP_005826969.1 hypothetical protein GUITHDRAFT_113984 [Guillardia theta CCMP2712]
MSLYLREDGGGMEQVEMGVLDSLEEARGQQKQLLTTSSQGETPCSHEEFLNAGVYDVMREAYSLSMIRRKAYITLHLRLCKGAALIVNEKVGRFMFGWKAHENRILDYIGQETSRLCQELYGREESDKYVRVFLRRRFLYCIISTCVTILQICSQLLHVEVLAVLLSLVTLPITLVERQFATLVTKMLPRAERSLALQFSHEANEMVRKHFPALKKLPRARMHRSRAFNLTSLEMAVGFLQFVSAGIIVLFSLFVLLKRSLYLDVFLLSDWCLHPLSCLDLSGKVILFRVIKEACNWISPWIEETLTPEKYAFNERVVRSALTEIHRAAGIEELCRLLVESSSTRRRCAELVEDFVLCCKMEEVERDAEEAMEVVNLMMKAAECGEDAEQEHHHNIGTISLSHFHHHGDSRHSHQANFVQAEGDGHVHLLEDGIKFWHQHQHGSQAHEHAIYKTEEN